MSQRDKLSEQAIAAFVAGHPGWAHEGGALVKTYAFADYAAGIAFVVRLGFAAEKRDHHPDLHVGWRKVKAVWSTHDAGGITALDAEMAELGDRLHGG
jgi:4a-hydroxytetrahydrobiopterin dehydratase